MKICLIGNSHVACIREAWHENKTDLDITFFASHANTLFQTSIKGQRIVPTSHKVKENFKMTSNGQEYIDLTNYDVIVMHGLLLRPSFFLGTLQNLESSVFYSEMVLKASNPFYSSIGFHLISMIRSVSKVPIYFSHVPLPAKSVDKDIDEKTYLKCINLLQETINKYDVDYLPQNKKTMETYHSTKPEFTKNSTRLDVRDVKGSRKHPISDFNHMNKSFGDYFLENLENYLASRKKI